MLEPVEVEVERQNLDGARVLGSGGVDGTEALGKGPGEGLLHPIGVAHSREAHVERGVASAQAVVNGDLVVARHLGDLVEERLQLWGGSVEQLAPGEAIEERPNLAKRVGHGSGVRVLEKPTLLFPKQGHVRRALHERALRESPEEKRPPLEVLVLAPLSDDDGIDRLEVIDRRGIAAIVDLHQGPVVGRRNDLAFQFFHHPGEHHGEQRGISKDPERALRLPVGGPVGSDPVVHHPHEDEVLLVEPAQKIPGRREVVPIVPRTEALGRVVDRRQHVVEVLESEEQALQHREDLVLDAPHAVLRLDVLDAGNSCPFPGGIPIHTTLPLPSHGQDGMDGGEHAGRPSGSS
jgi:hypothetical protein